MKDLDTILKVKFVTCMIKAHRYGGATNREDDMCMRLHRKKKF
jgi:hypothetical protein